MVLPLLAAAGISAAGSIISGMVGNDAAKDAARAQREALARSQAYVEDGADARIGGLDRQGGMLDKAGDNYTAGQSAFNRATGQANRTLGNAQDRALGYLDPYTQGGEGANRMYLDALGVNGGDAQSGYYSQFQNDPGFAAAMDAGREAIDRSAAARGGLNSGGMAKDLYSFGQRAQLDAYQNRLNRLQQLGSQGFAAAGQAANTVGQYQGQIAGNQIGAGNVALGTQNALAGLNLNRGQLEAQKGDVRGGMYDSFAGISNQRGNVNANYATVKGKNTAGMVQGVADALGTAVGGMPGTLGGSSANIMNVASAGRTAATAAKVART